MSLDAEEVRNIIRDELKPVRQDVVSIRHSLDGNGRPGLKTRVALLEQKEQGRSMWHRASIGTAVSAVGMALWSLITGRG